MAGKRGAPLGQTLAGVLHVGAVRSWPHIGMPPGGGWVLIRHDLGECSHRGLFLEVVPGANVVLTELQLIEDVVDGWQQPQ